MKKPVIFAACTRAAIWLILFLGCVIAVPGQEVRHGSTGEEEEVFRPHHSVSLIITHANVSEGILDGRRRWLSLPAWGLNYNFIFHPRWAVGLHTDLIVEEFVVERHLGDGKELERNFPIAPAIMGMYRFGKKKRGVVELGAGGEFADGENFFLTRLGVEYGVEIGHHWDVFGVLSYDIKWEAYDTYTLGLGIGRAFGK